MGPSSVSQPMAVNRPTLAKFWPSVRISRVQPPPPVSVISASGAGKQRPSTRAAPQQAMAPYMSTARRVRVFVNGVQLGNTSVTHAESFGWNHPIFYSGPATLLHAGENVIDLRVRLNRFGCTQVLGLRLGPHDQLQRECDRVFFSAWARA